MMSHLLQHRIQSQVTANTIISLRLAEKAGKSSDIWSKYYTEKITEFNDVNILLNPQGTRY